MTYWLELLVDEQLRDIVEDKYKVRIKECVKNPFVVRYDIDWTDVKGKWHTAKFKTTDGKILTVKFKPTLDPNYGDPYIEPLEIKERNVKLVSKK